MTEANPQSQPHSRNVAGTTVDQDELLKFTEVADTWWDEAGPFKPLHRFNPVRVAYIQEKITEHFATAGNVSEQGRPQPLKGLSLLDVGCGGGLLAEPMARMGAQVSGVDAAEKNIGVAKLHAQQQGLDINYRAMTAEALAAAGEQYDVVLAMEIVEHVADVKLFIQTLTKLVKPGGLLFMATLNRTAKAYALAIVGAEYVLRWLPKGTHEWSKFVTPSEMIGQVEEESAGTMVLEELTGVSLNPLSGKWRLSNDVAVNYMALFKKAA